MDTFIACHVTAFYQTTVKGQRALEAMANRKSDPTLTGWGSDSARPVSDRVRPIRAAPVRVGSLFSPVVKFQLPRCSRNGGLCHGAHH